ncbi:hypothetical protein F5Y10DRAFT_260883 [Nemania abortiva]|nr:hypothetical protein F5Y10DRAFT_260883 [Nemania abortiva]
MGVVGSPWLSYQEPQDTIINEPWSINSSIFLVFSTNMKNSDWEVAENLGIFKDGSLDAPVQRGHEEWMSYQVIPDLFVNASLCFQANSLAYSDANMVAMGDLTEPVFTYDSQTGSIDTNAVQTFFGVNQSRRDPRERGILQV